MTEQEREIMLIAAEECAEVVQAISKCLRFGLDSEWNGVVNDKHLAVEIGDLLCMFDLMFERGIVNQPLVEASANAKLERLKIWSGIFEDLKMTKICTILVGVPGSGKSTWIQKHMPVANVMSTDIVIENVARGYGMTYNEGFKELIGFAEKVMWRHITRSIAEQVDFVIDRTNLSAKSRKKFIDKLKLHHYDVECVVFPTPEPEEWQRRLDSRPGKTIPQEAIDRMVASYEIPLESEGFTKISFV